jgi:hypothetical protein
MMLPRTNAQFDSRMSSFLSAPMPSSSTAAATGASPLLSPLAAAAAASAVFCGGGARLKLSLSVATT